MHPLCFQEKTRRSAPIYRLDDDSLLNIFYHYQLVFSETYGDIFLRPNWDTARWWYKPAQVCQQWRYLILASPTRLGLHLLCTYGTPVADMLEYSPPLPLIIFYLDDVREVSARDEEAILLALQHRDRVRRIGLRMPAANLLKHIEAMDGQFPILERLLIWPRIQHDISLVLPATFEAAPLLGMLSLSYVGLLVGTPLLTTTIGLTSLELRDIPPPAYFYPSYLVAKLSFMPQLEFLAIGFKDPIPTRNVERQPLHALTGTRVTLPNLRMLCFVGVSAYLERVLARISTPLLDAFQIQLFNQLSFTVPYFFQFINRTDNFSFRFAQLIFYQEHVILMAEPREGDGFTPFKVAISCRHTDWQVSAITQIFNALVPVLSVVESLALLYEERILSLEPHSEINPTHWRNLLRPFSGVKVLHVAGKLITRLAHSLQIEDGESPVELLPELKEFIYYKDGDPSDSFSSFIDARRTAGWPVILTQVPPPHSFLQ